MSYLGASQWPAHMAGPQDRFVLERLQGADGADRYMGLLAVLAHDSSPSGREIAKLAERYNDVVYHEMHADNNMAFTPYRAAIVLAGGQDAGTASATDIAGEIYIGFTVLPARRRQGIASAVARLVTAHIHAAGLPAMARARPYNHPSLMTLWTAGYATVRQLDISFEDEELNGLAGGAWLELANHPG